jgi:transketolase
MRGQFVKTVSKLIQNDDRVVLLLGDIGVYGFRDMLTNYPQRAYNIGILEQSTISLSAGLSLSNLIPIIHTIAPFIVERALEQIKVDLCYQGLGSNLVSVGASYDYAALGCTHHCPADIPTLNEIPDIELIVPGHPDEFDKLFNQNYDNDKTTYFRLSESKNNQSYNVQFGKNMILQEKGEVVIIAVGTTLKAVLEASSNLDVTIIYCTTIKPFDFSSIKKFLNKKILIVEPYYSGPIFTNIHRELNNLTGNFSMIGVPNKFINKYGVKDDIDKMIGLDSEAIKKRILGIINEK